MYWVGFNDFGQLNSHSEKSAKSACPGESIASHTTHLGTLKPQLFHGADHLDLIISFIWTNTFVVGGDGTLKAQGFNAGFKGEALTHFLEKHKIKVKDVVTVGNNRIVVQDCKGLCWLYQEGEKELRLLEYPHCDNHLQIKTASEKLLVALSGHKELHTAVLNADLKLTFSQPVPGLTVHSVSCGLEHVVLVSNSGQVYSYGTGSRGQLGHGELTVDRVTKPALVDTLEGIKVISVACGGWHSTAVTADGDMYVWGWNESGQLGLPNGKETDRKMDHLSSGSQTEICLEESSIIEQTSDKTGEPLSLPKESCDVPVRIIQNIEPVQVQTVPFGLDLPEDLKVKKVSCGTRHTCVLLDSGILMTCGWNTYGQLYHGDVDSRDFLETVQYFVDRHKLVIDVKAEFWNTAVQTRDNDET